MQTFRQRNKSIRRQKTSIALADNQRVKLMRDARALLDKPRLSGTILAKAAAKVLGNGVIYTAKPTRSQRKAAKSNRSKTRFTGIA